jgi:hypothetical protein
MPEQKDINQLVTALKDVKVSNERIIEILSSMIKQQMLYGGSLNDQIEYQLSLIKKY